MAGAGSHLEQQPVVCGVLHGEEGIPAANQKCSSEDIAHSVSLL